MNKKETGFRLLCLIWGIIFLVFAPIVILHPEKIYYSIPSPGSGYYWGLSNLNLIIGSILFIIGFILTTYSRYQREK